MRRFSLAFLTISFCVFVSSLLLLGCGGKKDDDDDVGPRPSKTKRETGPLAGSTLKKVEAKEYGTISGKIEFVGDAAAVIAAANASSTIAGKTDADFCLTGKKGTESSPIPIQLYETTQQDWRIGNNKGLGNVFVWIEPQQGYYFDIPADQLAAINKEVIISQPHCNFLPHCTVLFPSYFKDGVPVKTGQTLIIENDALVLHNAKISGGKNNPLNVGIPPRKGDIVSKDVHTFTPETGTVSIACNVHTWMKGYIRVHTHPYVTVSSVGADLKDPVKKVWEQPDSPAYGTYTIKGVPVGAKVKLFAWHEKAGYLTKASGDDFDLTKDTKKDFTAK